MKLTEKEIALVVDGMRIGIDHWQKLVDDATAGGQGNHPLTKMLSDQIERAKQLKVVLEDAETVEVLV